MRSKEAAPGFLLKDFKGSGPAWFQGTWTQDYSASCTQFEISFCLLNEADGPLHPSVKTVLLEYREEAPFTLPETKTVRTKKPLTTRTCALATLWEPNEEKRQSILTLHVRGYSVESNSQGSCSICISLEKEDKLDQRWTKPSGL